MFFVKMEENVFPCVVEMVMRFFKKYIYLFIWLHQALVVAVGSSSLIRTRTQAPCLESAESQPLHHQEVSVYKILALWLEALDTVLQFNEMEGWCLWQLYQADLLNSHQSPLAK